MIDNLFFNDDDNIFVRTSMYTNGCFGLKCRFEKVNKTHEIINKKMAPPFYDIILKSNKMNEIINLLGNS